ncbi:probable 39S ribosomal protein L49, mitochondrial isoform X1 [Neodiprion virginianus]|uniref:probable 39S ribosomal protein L49, mitochondrial isoform X1 n=1 Tax=Neodiprion virginianus TaxID=2961670 RepID=UPI001EE731EE|nr:probable 39S ribosomal protein L49, mitochondrial isoform X1 [Neodiprion virginianus]
MAALRIFARPCFSHIFSKTLASNLTKNTLYNNCKIQERYSSFKSSPQVGDPSQYTDFEISKDPLEWLYVERLLTPKTVPPAPTSTAKQYPSGWAPQSEDALKLPYFVSRTRNYLQPVYLQRSFRGMRRITILRKIEGDIWLLEAELKKHLEETTGKSIGTQIHEVAGILKFKGDQVIRIKEWLTTKGL